MAVRLPLLARRIHKWVALFVGIQVMIWTLSGLYMTAIHIDIIHGDHFIRIHQPGTAGAGRLADPVMAARALPGAQSVRLHWLMDRPTYIVSSETDLVLLDAATARPLPPPSAAQIHRLAEHWFSGGEQVSGVRLITDIPSEIRGRSPPVWRVDFAGWNKPTLYFSPRTGELLTRRHELWRIFDFVWMLHIMDYETRDNINNTLLRTFTWGAVLFALSGAWMLFYSFAGRRRRKTQS